MLTQADTAPPSATRFVSVDVCSVVVRLALIYVAESAGWTHRAGPSSLAVSDRCPCDRPIDVLVVRDEPAACQAATAAVMTGRARSVLLWNEPETLTATLDALCADAAVIPQRAIGLAQCAPQLSGRQKDTLRLLAMGRSSQSIANALSQSQSTTKRDIADLLSIFDAPNRTALVGRATQLGFIRSLGTAARRGDI
jgi:DNA-binding CsgD family transcriptional regulator